MRQQYSEDVIPLIREALIRDPYFKFKQKNGELQDGICPSCKEAQVFISLTKPFMAKCRRLNKCRWESTTKELYPDIFSNITNRYPATDENPHASADAYMNTIRGFKADLVKGMYSQGFIKNADKNEFYPSVKFMIDDRCYWQRVIDSRDERKNGAKNKIVGSYRGKHWMPPGQVFEEGEDVWITEGIFKSLAFLHIGRKSVATLSCTNFCRNLIKANRGKGINWILAPDNDNAGLASIYKNRKELETLGESFSIALPSSGEDWDDVFKADRLDEKYIINSYWEGQYQTATSPSMKAMLYWVKHRYSYSVFAFNNKLHSYEIKDNEDAGNFAYGEDVWTSKVDGIHKFIADFNKFAQTTTITNCYPKLLYIEKPKFSDEDQLYYFSIDFPKSPSEYIGVTGEVLNSNKGFGDILLKKTAGGYFEGSNGDMKFLRRKWLNSNLLKVNTLNYIGYSKEYSAYVFNDFAYANGQCIMANDMNFLALPKHNIKVRNQIDISCSDSFKNIWIDDYKLSGGINGMVLLCWWLGTMFAEQIRDESKDWPFLEFTGEQGSGKSCQIGFLWKCCGRDNYEGFDPNKSSYVGWLREFEHVSNLPVVILESDRILGDKNTVSRGFGFEQLKSLADGGALRTTGRNTGNNETKQEKFKGGLLISQNSEVDGDPAVLARIVHCHCTKLHHTEATLRATQRLQSLDVKEVCGFLHQVLTKEKKLLSIYREAYTRIEKEYHELNPLLQMRIVQLHAKVAAWAKVLPEIFQGKVSEEEATGIEEFIYTRALSRQQRLGADHPEVSAFWDLYDLLNEHHNYNSKSLEECLNHSNHLSEIAVNIPHFIQTCNLAHTERLPSESILKKLLPDSRKHKFIGKKHVWSKLLNKTIYCWVFIK